MLLLEVTTVLLVALVMAPALAHVLEFPGKMRLGREAYFATQSIYYPGFTIAGIAEPLAIVAALVFLLMLPGGSTPFWWGLVALLALAAMHLVFWTVTQPVNRFWVARLRLTGAAQQFFMPNQSPATRDAGELDQWEHLRDRWEHSHIARAVLSAIALISMTVAVVLQRGAGLLIVRTV
jgi:hypothetical protein